MDKTPAPIFRKQRGAPFAVNAPKAAILPIILPPPTLRPLAFRTFTKKHSLTLTSSALQELASFIGRHCGSGWREEGLAERVLEEVARSWKNRNGGVIVEGSSKELQEILKTLEGNMSGGRITGPTRGLPRGDSMLDLKDNETLNTRLGLRPAEIRREDSNTSFGMSGLGVDEEQEESETSDPRAWLKIIDAYDQPRFIYNVGKKHFEKDTSTPSLLPPASHKTTVFRNRYNVIHQRLLRNETFQSSAVSSSRKQSLSPYVTRLLVVLPTGDLAISDLTGTIALDLSQAVAIPDDSAWFCPGMIVLVDGVYEEEDESVGKGLSGSSGVGGTLGGRFQGFFVGQPPCERRQATLGISGPDGSERAVGTKMRRLERRLLRSRAEEDTAPSRGRVYAVLARGGSGGSIEYKEYFDALASTLETFQPLLQSSTFVFVPGDNDGWVSSFTAGASVPLPRKQVPDMFTSRIRRAFATANAEVGGKSNGTAVWTSNPSRISLFGPNHELVVFRDDVSARLRRASVRLKPKAKDASGEQAPGSSAAPPEDVQPMDIDAAHHDDPTATATGSPVTPLIPHDVHAAQKLVKTILDQGYLAPFRQAIRPVHWDYSSALHLYPLPTAMVLLDTTAPPFCVTYEGCHVMNPGSVLVPGRKGIARWVEYDVGRLGRLRECTV
ncbi:DNA polymerase [Fusarium oxysporum]|nr:DNA polymerase [Fusarium oxysporum]